MHFIQNLWPVVEFKEAPTSLKTYKTPVMLDG